MESCKEMSVSNKKDYYKQAVFPSKNFKKEAFLQIPSNLTLLLYEKYKLDFDIFEYIKPE